MIDYEKPKDNVVGLYPAKGIPCRQCGECASIRFHILENGEIACDTCSTAMTERKVVERENFYD